MCVRLWSFFGPVNSQPRSWLFGVAARWCGLSDNARFLERTEQSPDTHIYIYNARLSPFLDRLGSALYVKSRFHFWYYGDLPVSRFFPLFLRQRRRQSRGKARIRVFGWNFNDFVSRLSERSDQWTEGLFLERAFRTRITANGSRNGERQDNQFCANEKPRERRCIKRIWQLVDWIHELLRFVHLVSILFSQFAWPARTLLVLRTSATEVRCDSFADK